MRRRLSLSRCKWGTTAVEYAMVAALISVAAYAAMGIIGGSVAGFFQTVASSL